MKLLATTTIVVLLIYIGILLNDILKKKRSPPSVSRMEPPSQVVTVVNDRTATAAPPFKRYKPGYYQQMGLLLGGPEPLPLYGKSSSLYRGRYNYYSSTTGDMSFSLPVSYNGRDCTEDIGCDEFYGGESVTVTGQPGTFTTNIYRTTF